MISNWLWFGIFYIVTIFALGGILHRYFGHRAFRTSRWFQFVLAVFDLPGISAAALIYIAGGYTAFVTVYCLNFLVAVHTPSAVNYFCHKGGRRDFDTEDDSTNRILLGYLFLGEGWHNNHHCYPASARLGFRRYEFDASYQLLRLLAALGLIWDLRRLDVTVTAEERKALWSTARY